MPPTATQRRYHHGNLREELLARAEAIVRERGAEALSLRELAREAGVSHAAPSRHFADRQALLDALALRGFARLGQELRAAATARGGFERRLAEVCTAYVQFATRDAALLALMFAGKHREGAGELRAAADEAFATVLAVIEEGQAAGGLVPGDPHGPGTLLFATLQGLASLVGTGMIDAESVPGVVRESVRGLLHGLRPR